MDPIHNARQRLAWRGSLVATGLLALVWAISMGGQAKAAPAASGRGVPAPVPTSSTPIPTAPPLPTGIPQTCADNFSDVLPSDWFYVPVRWVACQNIASGYDDGTFRPYNNSTRAQFAKMVVLASQWPLLDPEVSTFSDVAPGSTFYTYVETAAAHGVISGYDDGTFRPGNNVTRGQVSKMIVLAKGLRQFAPQTPTFSDVAPGSTFYVYVETAHYYNIISGYEDGTFRPGNNATRSQLAKIIYQTYTMP